MTRHKKKFEGFAASSSMGGDGAKGHFSLLLPLLVSGAMAVFSILWQHGSFLHPEVESRLPYYLSHGSLLHKVYDSDYLEYGSFQARELSYVFDYIDCQFIAGSVALGHPHFLSLTYYVFMVLISLVLWQFGFEELKLPRWMVLCVLGMLWTTPAVFLGGTFFRTGKIGLSLAVVVLYWRIFVILRCARANPEYGLSARSWLLCFACAWAATLFDRQGVFLVGVIIVFLGCWFLGYRQKSTLKLIGAFATALALSFLYDYVIGPLLTLSLNNYWPGFNYQHLPWQDLLEKPAFYVGAGIALYLDNVRFFLGNIPRWGVVMVILGLFSWVMVAGWRRQEGKPFFSAMVGLFLSQTVLICVMTTLMVLRHEALRWPDVRRVYYLLPVISMLGMTLLLTLWRLETPLPWPKWCWPLVLSAALLGNITALPSHDAILKEGHLKSSFQSTPALLDALRNLRNPRYPISPEIARNRVFQFFHDGRFSKTPPVLRRDKNKVVPGEPGDPAF